MKMKVTHTHTFVLHCSLLCKNTQASVICHSPLSQNNGILYFVVVTAADWNVSVSRFKRNSYFTVHTVTVPYTDFM